MKINNNISRLNTESPKIHIYIGKVAKMHNFFYIDLQELPYSMK